jgi:hypothetical protein
MRLLLDTHALLGWLDRDASLSTTARQAIADESNDVFLSAASAWEITTKFRLGKLPGAALVAADTATCIADQGFLELPSPSLMPKRQADIGRDISYGAEGGVSSRRAGVQFDA